MGPIDKLAEAQRALRLGFQLVPPQWGVGKRTEKEQCLRVRREEDSGAALIYVTVPASQGPVQICVAVAHWLLQKGLQAVLAEMVQDRNSPRLLVSGRQSQADVPALYGQGWAWWVG